MSHVNFFSFQLLFILYTFLQSRMKTPMGSHTCTGHISIAQTAIYLFVNMLHSGHLNVPNCWLFFSAAATFNFTRVTLSTEINK